MLFCKTHTFFLHFLHSSSSQTFNSHSFFSCSLALEKLLLLFFLLYSLFYLHVVSITPRHYSDGLSLPHPDSSQNNQTSPPPQHSLIFTSGKVYITATPWWMSLLYSISEFITKYFIAILNSHPPPKINFLYELIQEGQRN